MQDFLTKPQLSISFVFGGLIGTVLMMKAVIHDTPCPITPPVVSSSQVLPMPMFIVGAILTMLATVALIITYVRKDIRETAELNLKKIDAERNLLELQYRISSRAQ